MCLIDRNANMHCYYYYYKYWNYYYYYVNFTFPYLCLTSDCRCWWLTCFVDSSATYRVQLGFITFLQIFLLGPDHVKMSYSQSP